jgi:hypothetical protein
MSRLKTVGGACADRNQEAATFSIALPSVADDARGGVALQASGELPVELARGRPAIGRDTPIVSLRRPTAGV